MSCLIWIYTVSPLVFELFEQIFSLNFADVNLSLAFLAFKHVQRISFGYRNQTKNQRVILIQKGKKKKK